MYLYFVCEYGKKIPIHFDYEFKQDKHTCILCVNMVGLAIAAVFLQRDMFCVPWCHWLG